VSSFRLAPNISLYAIVRKAALSDFVIFHSFYRPMTGQFLTNPDVFSFKNQMGAISVP
jgi:hypothetical protein